MTDHMLTTGQVAIRLGVHPKTVKRWAEEGKIEVVLLPSGHMRVPKTVVEQILKGGYSRVDTDRGDAGILNRGTATEEKK